MNRYGTTYETDADGRLIRVRDRAGHVALEVAWNRHGMERLVVPGAIVDGAVIQDELLGAAHAILDAERLATTMSAIDWARPTELPAIAAPALVPFGAAAPLMNAIAILAARAGIASLRYAGPYPSAALWRTLLRSFTTSAAEEDFTRDFLSRAAVLSREPIAIDFAPAPHERVELPRGHVELRDGLERAVIDGVAYTRDESSMRLVREDPDISPPRTPRPPRSFRIGDAVVREQATASGADANRGRASSDHKNLGVSGGLGGDISGSPIHAEVWFGDTVWARVATFAADGSLVDGPHPITASTSHVIGKQLPPPLAAALAELIVDSVPAPLATAAHDVLAQPIVWADLGARAAAYRDNAFLVHAALWERVAPHGMARLALALVEALVPVVTREAARRLARAV